MKIRFKVTGTDENGLPFEDYAETVDVSPGGGCLIFAKEIKKGQNLKVYSPNGASFIVKVRWFKYDTRKKVRYLGFQLVEPLEKWVVSNGADRLRQS